MGQRRDRIGEHDLYLARDQIGHCKRGAAIGNMRHPDPGLAVEQLGEEMIGGADTRRAVVQFAGLAFGERYELLHGFDAKLRIDHHDVRIGGGHRDRREILQRIVRQLFIDGGVDRDRSGLAEQQRVAVGLGFVDEIGADDRTGTAAVLDHDRLPDRLADPFGNDARDRVGAAAGGVGHDQPNRVRGIFVGVRGERRCQCGRRQRKGERNAPRMCSHGLSLPDRFLLTRISGRVVVSRPAA